LLPRSHGSNSLPGASELSGPALQLVDSYALGYLLRPRISTEADESPPLLCFLHGYDEGAPLDIFNALRRHGPFRSLNPSTYKDRFVIVAPQLPVRGDLWNRYADPVRQIVLDEAKRFACDLRRLYLTGFSFGGNGVFDLSFAQARMWAALWPVDPTRVPNRSLSIPIWLSLGEISRLQARSFIRALGLESAEIVRSADRVWSDAGEDHVGTATQAYNDERVYRWLLSNRLQ
jgi:predicted peptidase